MAVIYLWLASALISLINCKKKLIIYSITNANQEIISAQTLAVSFINNDTSLLSEYELEIQLLDAQESGVIALKHAVDLVSNPLLPSLIYDNNSVIVPIILGCPWSSMTVMTAPALNAFNFGQISSSATSITLSDTTSYSHFYRTISADSMQSEGIVELCKAFGWDTVGIMHDNDAYGIYLAVGILELSTQNAINTYSISYQRRDSTSIERAANSLRSLNVFIIILISHGSDLGDIIAALVAQNIWGYPYYYIGVDSWIDEHDVITQNVEKYAEGYIGTIPWQPGSLSVSDYESNLQVIYNTSLFYEQHIKNQWSHAYENNPSLVYNESVSGAKAVYGWDSMYTLAYALDKFDQRYSLLSIFDDSMNAEQVLDALDDIITNEIHFLGATGNVSFFSNGDRKNGLYGYGNILPNGSVQYFGYFNDDLFVIKQDLVVWPTYFTERGLIPRSSILITRKLLTINQTLFILLCAFVAISTVIILCLLISTIYFRKESIVRAGSWKLNMFVCTGCLLAYACIILFGIDEFYVDESNTTAFKIICNTRISLLSIAFTLIYMPLFMKTYRLAKIFRSFDVKKINDSKLILGVIVCVLMDVVLLSVLIAIEPLQRKYIEGDTLIMDELRETHYEYGTCVCSKQVQTTLYLTLGVWKLIELVFGIYVAMIVSRIGLRQLTKFNETGQQVLAVVFTVFVLAILSMYLFLSTGDDLNVKYGMESICVLMACNVASIVNITPRLYAIYCAKIKKDDDALAMFEQTFEETVMKTIRMQIKTFNKSMYHLNLDSVSPQSPDNTMSEITPKSPEQKTIDRPKLYNGERSESEQP